MVKLLPGQLAYVPTGPLPDLSETRKRNIQKRKTFKNVLDTLDESSDPGVGVGERFAIRAKELEIENDYDNIKYLENKLNDTSLSFDEHKKSLLIFLKLKKIYPKKE